jgi:hypothetical protein
MAGDRLAYDLKRLEIAYMDGNIRELELTKHVSLRQLNPVALLALKATGTCQITVPEWLYDLDCPGHYMRRIKNVALSIPSVVGPYTSINCTLSLLKSSLRKSPITSEVGYARQDADNRFIDYIGAVQSIVTSSGQNDSGLFETNLRDERFLPFEGAGAESTWKLDLTDPREYPAFDYATISDVILHVRYTARQCVDINKAKAALNDLFRQADQSGLALLFNLRYDFPTEWAAFVNGAANFRATIRRNYFPYFAQGKTIALTVNGCELYGENPSMHHLVADPVVNVNPNNLEEFIFTIPEDTTGQIVLTRNAQQVFLVIRYTLS